MFEVDRSVLNLFLFVLRVPFDFALNAIHKNGRLSLTCLEEGFEFLLAWKRELVTFNSVLVLLLLEENFVLKEGGCKKSVPIILCSHCFEVVFTLLAELVTLHV